jgi:hypothetical protein
VKSIKRLKAQGADFCVLALYNVMLNITDIIDQGAFAIETLPK